MTTVGILPLRVLLFSSIPTSTELLSRKLLIISPRERDGAKLPRETLYEHANEFPTCFCPNVCDKLHLYYWQLIPNITIDVFS